MFYEVYVVAVSSVNGTLYSSEAITARTNEGGKYATTKNQSSNINKQIKPMNHPMRCSRPI